MKAIPVRRRSAARRARTCCLSDLELPVRRPINREPTHPGELMREILDEHAKMPIAEAARRMEISRPALYAVLNGESAVTPDMALRFARLTGGTPDLYVNMQTNRDLWLAAHRLNAALDRIRPAGR
jgi:antitoxin HigA-1